MFIVKTIKKENSIVFIVRNYWKERKSIVFSVKNYWKGIKSIVFSVKTIERKEEVLLSVLKLLKGKNIVFSVRNFWKGRKSIVFSVKTIKKEEKVFCSLLKLLKRKKKYCVHVTIWEIEVFSRLSFAFIKAWFALSQLRPRQRPISSQNKAISVKDNCSTL